MFTGEIDAYILSHIDEEGDLLSALNRDANVNPVSYTHLTLPTTERV